jgi:hypothetical protein
MIGALILSLLSYAKIHFSSDIQWENLEFGRKEGDFSA